LTPAASVDRIDGLVEDAAGVVRLKARVRAVAENNKANRAVEKLIARHLKIGKTAVRSYPGIRAGPRPSVSRVDPEALVDRVRALAG
jgi:uncharacterized protein YggU (UPF0235/DUF167 family)